MTPHAVPSVLRRGAVLAAGLVLLAALLPAAPASAVPAVALAATPNLGPNVMVFTPSMSTAQIQQAVDGVYAQQQSNQFGTQRYALLFEPGTYGSTADPLIFDVGYYTEVDGLGRNPGDVTINGAVDVLNQCDSTGCTALDNFWRSLSNLTIDVTGGSGCAADTEFWAVSQAAPFRRVQVNGKASLMDYCSDGPQYASGGYIADSAFTGSNVTNGSQQQFFVHNTNLDGWSNGVWNQVFAGSPGAPAQSFPDPTYTTLASDPVEREKPYLYVDGNGAWNVFVPAARTDSSGPSWSGGTTAGRSVPLSSFYVARPGVTVADLNDAMASGKNLLFTPAVYNFSQTIDVKRANTVVLGLGVATITATNGALPMRIENVPGVDVAGLMFDAGTKNSPALLQVGDQNAAPGNTSAANPTTIQDVFFRVGGPHVGKATVSLRVGGDHVLLDDIWAWRADHGTGVGWTSNTARNGVVVNGDDVTATGLFVEHYQQYDVVWNGERGETVFFQNEMPYDPPSQSAWRHGSTLGWAAYKVGDGVTQHVGYGLGSYIYTNVVPSLHASNAFEVPNRTGVVMHDLLTVSLNKAGTIDHVVDGVGDPVTPDHAGPSFVTSYANGVTG